MIEGRVSEGQVGELRLYLVAPRHPHSRCRCAPPQSSGRPAAARTTARPQAADATKRATACAGPPHSGQNKITPAGPGARGRRPRWPPDVGSRMDTRRRS